MSIPWGGGHLALDPLSRSAWPGLACSEVVFPPNGGGLSCVQVHCHLSLGRGVTSHSCSPCASPPFRGTPISLIPSLPFMPDVCPCSSSPSALEVAPLPTFSTFCLWVWFVSCFPKVVHLTRPNLSPLWTSALPTLDSSSGPRAVLGAGNYYVERRMWRSRRDPCVHFPKLT